MSSFSLAAFFRQFLETRAPLLFLLGSVALGILGNALYELLATSLGAPPALLAGMVASAILVLGFVVVGVRRLAGAFEHSRTIAQPAPDREAAPHAGLVLHVGLSDPGPERAIIEWHTRAGTLAHCWLIVTPQVEQRAAEKLGDLRQLVLERNALPRLVKVDDALQVEQLYRRMREVLDEARHTRGALPLIADITGGNKPMTAGLLLACLDAGVAMQYWHAPRDAKGQPLLTQRASAMQIVLGGQAQKGSDDDSPPA